MRKSIFIVSILASFVLFFSCTADITLTEQKDGSVKVLFSGRAGDEFNKLINGNNEGSLIDVKQISYQLEKAGFYDVKVTNDGIKDVKISMLDKSKSSYIFTSGIVSSKMDLNINKENLRKFYDEADEQTRLILDLLIAPIFNGEEMSADEYVELLSSVYGSAVAEEVQKGFVNISLVNSSGKKSSVKIPVADLLCGNAEITF